MMKKVQTFVDELTTAIAAILIAIMFLVITANVVLRLMPATNGFSWYMEFSQYANVWAMMIGAAGIACAGTNLRVEVIDSLIGKTITGYRIIYTLVDIAEFIFYAVVTASGYQTATKAKQAVSTMPRFTMGQVYWIFPVAGVLCMIGVVIHLIVLWTTVPEKFEATDASASEEVQA